MGADVREGRVKRRVGHILVQHHAGHVQQLQLGERHLTLLDMLGLVVYARFAAPANHQQAGKAIYLLVHQGGDGVDRVAQAGILHIAQRGTACGQIVTGAQPDGVALVGGNDVMLPAHAKGRIERIAQPLELGIRHTGEKVDARSLAGSKKMLSVHRGSPCVVCAIIP